MTTKTRRRAKPKSTTARQRKQLDGSLANLTQAELIRLLLSEDVEYIFKHALVQDTAQSSLLHSERKRLHRLVGESLKQLNPRALDEIAAVLARHYAEAGDSENTLEFATRAGDASARVYAHPEARVHYGQALDALAALPDTEATRRKHVDLLINQVSVSLRNAGPQTSIERMRQAEQLLENFPDGIWKRTRLARIYYWMGHAYVHGNQPAKSIEYMQRVLPIAQELNELELLAVPAAVIGRALAIQGKFERSYELLTQALAALEKVENWHEWIITKASLGLVQAVRGYPAQALAEAEQALERATALQTLTGIAQGHMALGEVYWAGGDWQRALEQARLTQEAAERGGDHLLDAVALVIRALAHFGGGEYEAGVADIEQMETVRQRLGGRVIFNTWLIAARISGLVQQGRIAEARALSEQSQSEVQASGDLFGTGLIERALAQTAVQSVPPQWAEADAHFAASLRLLQEGGARLDAARTHVAWGEMLQQCGDTDNAREHFQQAAAQFLASDLKTELERVQGMLENL
jgi:tetratricopeptide (TPR) repeat protein